MQDNFNERKTGTFRKRFEKEEGGRRDTEAHQTIVASSSYSLSPPPFCPVLFKEYSLWYCFRAGDDGLSASFSSGGEEPEAGRACGLSTRCVDAAEHVFVAAVWSNTFNEALGAKLMLFFPSSVGGGGGNGGSSESLSDAPSSGQGQLLAISMPPPLGSESLFRRRVERLRGSVLLLYGNRSLYHESQAAAVLSGDSQGGERSSLHSTFRTPRFT